MNKNNSGFTLVEVLAVISIIAILMIVAVTGVSGISAGIRKSMFCTKVKTIENNAILWGEENRNSLGESLGIGQDYTNVPASNAITIQRLVDEGFIKKDELTNGEVQDPRTKLSMNEMKIKVYIKNNRIYAKMYEAEVIDNCK